MPRAPLCFLCEGHVGERWLIPDLWLDCVQTLQPISWVNCSPVSPRTAVNGAAPRLKSAEVTLQRQLRGATRACWDYQPLYVCGESTVTFSVTGIVYLNVINWYATEPQLCCLCCPHVYRPGYSTHARTHSYSTYTWTLASGSRRLRRAFQKSFQVNTQLLWSKGSRKISRNEELVFKTKKCENSND